MLWKFIIIGVFSFQHFHRIRSAPKNVGSQKNDWTFPVFETGSNDDEIRKYFTREALNFENSDWEECCSVIDKVMTEITRVMTRKARERFPGLAIENILIKQGSSREGLKVCDPLEFDYILPFQIECLELRRTNIYNEHGDIIPGLFKQRVLNSSRIPGWIEEQELLEHDRSGSFLNTKNLQRKIFSSLWDKSIDEHHKRRQLGRIYENDDYTIHRSVDPPTLKITIAVKKSFGLRGLRDSFIVNEALIVKEDTIYIEVDLVPAMVIASDFVPDPYTVHTFHQNIDGYPKGWCRRVKQFLFPSSAQDTTTLDTRMMGCERYGIMKWVNKKNPAISVDDKDMLWRESTCGYEKHILDVARRNQSQKYVMTACRLLKGALRKFPPDSKEQLGSVLKSYHLKNITLYCFLFLTIPSKNNQLSSVREALGYFVEYLKMSVNEGCLPHFFYGNPHISLMLPYSPFEQENTRYNIFAGKDRETLRQARYSLPRLLETLDGLYDKRWLLDQEKIMLFKDLLH